MNIFKALTPVTYWILIALWAFILYFYIKRLRNDRLKGRLLFTLLLILSIDAFRTLFESIYFGAWYTSLAGFLPIEVHAFVVRPEMVFIPKILNVVSALAVIIILLYRWIPQEAKEVGKLERLVDRRTLELEKSNKKLKKEIGNRTQAEEKVKKYADNLEIIFNSTPNILVLINQEGRVDMINHKGADFFKKNKNSVLGLLSGEVFNCLNSFDGESCGRTPDCHICPIRTRVMGTFETERLYIEEKGQMTFLLGGKETTVDLLISTSLLELDGIKKVLLSLTDNTERMRDEKLIWDSNQRFQKIFHSHLDSIFLLNAEIPPRILETNEATKKLFGYNADDLIGETAEKLHIDLYHFNTFKNKVNSATEMYGYLNDFEFSMKRKDGTVFLSEHRVVELTDDEGRRTGWVSIVRDLTERKQIEEHLQQAQKMESIGNLAGGIAHDFNNILFPIIGYSEMLIDDLPLNSPERENAEGIMTAGKRGRELVKQILAFSRQDEHKRIPVRVQQVLKEVVKLSRSSIPTNIEINHHLQQDCGLVLADSTQLHQIGMNLITNAYHAVEENSGKIEIQVKGISFEKDELTGGLLCAGKYIQLSVSDNGCGILPAVMDKIFEPYFTTKEKGKGTGLGLSVVYGIVKEHKGDIKVSSEVGKGTTINVYLPVIAVPGATESSSEQMPVGRGTERILLVDDEAPIANLVKQMLERLGYSVSMRTSSVDALEAFKAHPYAYSLVISDMSMPHMTGDRLAREMLGIRPDILIIICTGFSERVNEDMVKSMGIKGFLMKPVIKSIMAKEVRKVLDDAGKI